MKSLIQILSIRTASLLPLVLFALISQQNVVASDDAFILNDGHIDALWGGDKALSFFDERADYGDCTNEASGTESCDSVDWSIVEDTVRGTVLEVTYLNSAGHAGLVVGPSPPVDLSGYAAGSLNFDIKILSEGTTSQFLIKVESGSATSGELPIGGITMENTDWQSVSIPVSALTASGDLQMSGITAPMVFFPAFQTGAGLQYLIDNVRFTGFDETSNPPEPPNGNIDYTLTAYGASTIADRINPSSYRCVFDYGNWIYNAGVVEPGISGCNTATGTPTGSPTPRAPQLIEPASLKPTATHRWWGSVPFLGEMRIGEPADAAYITPDPLMARISERGVRIMGIPGGLSIRTDGFLYDPPDPFAEVFDGIAVGNTKHSNLDAFMKDSSAGGIIIEWRSGQTPVMDAVFIHGSPHVYFNVFDGQMVLRTLREDGGEKGVFLNTDERLGIWTAVAGNRNDFLITGNGETSFSDAESNEILITDETGKITLTWLPVPQNSASASASDIEIFSATAQSRVASVTIDHEVDVTNNQVTVTHRYLDADGDPIDTLMGLHPLHWKFSETFKAVAKTRSARGVIQFVEGHQFSYQIPFSGILPSLPYLPESLDRDRLESLIHEFTKANSGSWNTRTDTYWSGKNYGKVAELSALARAAGFSDEADTLLAWLKTELEDWFSAESNGKLDSQRYFVYDSAWSTLLGMEESFSSHQQLNDHHFHYGYFVRAAAEVCRIDLSWCGPDQFGPMIELLIRDYAAGEDDPLFPPLRNFDPANGFSWASGAANFVRGNNNESTSEAANAYGAIILYGLATNNPALIERGIYLHASTAATYWQYWNNIDGYLDPDSDWDNFPTGYDKITTSIIWGDGSVFSTWFSPRVAHILGIQGLPSNTLTMHVGLYVDYMRDYVALGLSESPNGKPSGLGDDEWRDLWWNLWALVDPEAAIADYVTVGQYLPEAGETKAHTYHWLYTLKALGEQITISKNVTADYPSAMTFEKEDLRQYVVYNFEDEIRLVSFSDGHTVNAKPGFSITNNSTEPDLDTDGDGFLDINDGFPDDESEWLDTDGDGQGNNADLDDDGDGFSDTDETAEGTNPLNPSSCPGCFSFDIDQNDLTQPLTDGLLVIRYLFGFTGEALIAGAISPAGARTSPNDIATFLNVSSTALDIDGNGKSEPLTDGLLLIRALFGFTGSALTDGAIGEGASRDNAEQIRAYIAERLTPG